jgi:hypothetical protein
MKQLPFILASLLFVGCAYNSEYGRRTHLPDLSNYTAKETKPNDYCTVTWDEEGNSRSTCYHFLSVQEMEERVLMSQEPCKEIPKKEIPPPRYKSDE